MNKLIHNQQKIFISVGDTSCGLYSRCKACCKKTDTKRKDKTVLYKQKWALNNPEHKKNYYEKNKETILRKMREKASTPEEKLKTKNNNLKRFYGINLNQYNEMLVRQNHKCEICGIDELESGKKGLFVDHNHVTRRSKGITL